MDVGSTLDLVWQWSDSDSGADGVYRLPASVGMPMGSFLSGAMVVAVEYSMTHFPPEMMFPSFSFWDQARAARSDRNTKFSTCSSRLDGTAQSVHPARSGTLAIAMRPRARGLSATRLQCALMDTPTSTQSDPRQCGAAMGALTSACRGAVGRARHADDEAAARERSGDHARERRAPQHLGRRRRQHSGGRAVRRALLGGRHDPGGDQRFDPRAGAAGGRG